MGDMPEIHNAPKVDLLFEENLPQFNRLAREGKAPDLRNANLSGFDLRNAQLRGLDLSGCYMRECNLRGVDLRDCNLEGASLQGAKISGAYFPSNLNMEEIRASVEHGTRMRTNETVRNTRLILELLGRLYQQRGEASHQ